MASPFDMHQFNAKERNAARKDLLKKIEVYNKQMRRKKEPSFPLSSPTVDLVYRGVMKFTYDRGYAIQTKSMLVGSDLSTDDVIDQLIDSLGLTGSVDDYELEEINHMTQEVRTIGKSESPLEIQLQYGPHNTILEIRLVQVRDSRVNISRRGRDLMNDSDSDDEETLRGRRNMTPKDEVIDHGSANVEVTMDEALQDVPLLVRDIQERLRLLSDTIAVGGKPRATLPPRRSLWDTLKPQVSALVKDIRHLVDNGEFLATRHCQSNECRLIMTLLLELITDYSRELIAVTKELCGLKGVAHTDFVSSVSKFIQQINYISRLVGKTYDSLHAVALSGHLLHATSPESFLKGPLEETSVFTGSGGISGVLIFIIITGYLGLIRGAYEDKTDYYAALASNMLQSTNKALEIIQKTNEYSLLHLHPLRSRVTDMEHKLKVAMDTLVKRVKIATSRRPPPASTPDMLLAGHSLIVASLDFLMVAQCASLLHKVIIEGWEILELPWVSGWVSSSSKESNGTDVSSSNRPTSSYITDQISSSSDTPTERSYGTTSTASSGRRRNKERKSRIPIHRRESGDGMDAAQLAQKEGSAVKFGQFTLPPSNLPLYYGEESGEDADDEGGSKSQLTSRKTSLNDTTEDEFTTTSRSESLGRSTPGFQSPVKPLSPHLFEKNSTQYMGDAVKRLRQHLTLNKAIAKVAEGLFLTVTQKTNWLVVSCQEKSKEKYTSFVEDIISAAKQIRQEVSAMECDLLGGHSMEESLANSKGKMDSSVRDIYLSLTSAVSSQAGDKDRMRLMASVTHMNDISSKTIADALAAVREHKKALTQAEKLEQEFIALMTGQTFSDKTSTSTSMTSGSPGRSKRKISGNLKLQSDSDAESVIFEETQSRTFTPGGTWSKATPKVVGGTIQQLVQRVTYHRIIDSEFVETFVLVFHRYMSSMDLLQSLIERFHLTTPKELTSEYERETFESEVVIPVKLRTVHVLRLWLQYHPQDFTEGSELYRKFQEFLLEMAEPMRVCSRQLSTLLKGETPYQTPSRAKMSSQPIMPLEPENGKDFEILDSNTLELARQLCILYNSLFRKIQLKELLSLDWENVESSETKGIETIRGIMTVKIMSQQLSRLVTRRILSETNEEDQAIVLSYFIKTAESCHSLKNYEAVSSLCNGLKSDSVRGAVHGAWQILTEGELQTFRTLRDLVSSDMNYHRYRVDLKNLHLVPCIPLLNVTLRDISSIQRDNPDNIPGKGDVLNFSKWRQLSKVLLTFHQYKNLYYNLLVVEVIQNYLSKLQTQLTEDEWIRMK